MLCAIEFLFVYSALLLDNFLVEEGYDDLIRGIEYLIV